MEYQPSPISPPPAITINDHLKYEVDYILDDHTHLCHREFLVKWVGYPEHDATWEPEDHLHNSKEMVQDYLALLLTVPPH